MVPACGPSGRDRLDGGEESFNADPWNNHNHWDQPVLLAGGASGKLKIDGRHINYIPQMTFPRPLVGPQGGPDTGRIHISILQAHGMMVNQFGVVTGGPLAEIMA
jgi:hypothetical protein